MRRISYNSLPGVFDIGGIGKIQIVLRPLFFFRQYSCAVSCIKEAIIEYKYEPEEKTLYRSEEGVVSGSDFHGSKQILSMTFITDFTDDEDIEEQKEEEEGTSPAEKREFKCLSIAMQIAANEYHTSSRKTDTSTLSIACQFYSTCVESEFRISKLKKIKDEVD